MNFRMVILCVAALFLAGQEVFASSAGNLRLVFMDGKDTVEQTLAVPAPDFVDLVLPSGAVCKVDVTTYEPSSKPIALYLDVEKTPMGGGPFKFFSAGGMLPEKGFGMVQLLIGDYWCSVQQEK